MECTTAMQKQPMVKSPSDTTIYRPALFKENNQADDVINRISNFVENIRIQSRRVTPESQEVRSGKGEHTPNRRQHKDKQQLSTSTSSRETADQIVLDAEQFKAKLQPPKGESLGLNVNGMGRVPLLDEDDEFFHVTCHISQTLKSKIAKGEFVDLDLLIPKDKYGGYVNAHKENKVELVSRDGHMYFKPIKENSINGLRKWEQTFRMYAAIYTESNPERSGEIWQYMHVINVAASSFQWDNVANYDLTFRQLMACRPHRSWAKLYNQGWNLAMRDPIGKVQTVTNYQQNSAKSFSTHSNSNGKRDWHDGVTTAVGN